MHYIYVFLCFSGKATGRRDLTSTCSPSGKAVPWFDAKPKCWPQSVVHQLLQAFVRDWSRWERQNYPSSIWNWSNARLGTSHSRQVWAVFWLQVRMNWITSVAMQKWFLVLWLNLKIEKHIQLQIFKRKRPAKNQEISKAIFFQKTHKRNSLSWVSSLLRIVSKNTAD